MGGHSSSRILLWCLVFVAMVTPFAGIIIPDSTVRQAIDAALRIAEAEIVDQISLNNLLFQTGKVIEFLIHTF